ncbi:hypothetical protein DSAG12_01560 [Promethearchaeum syntrophicum]|uniref:Uncharacterized protein n=1 Tax=Promethearchaeum syntrophicum TaxID=2594042 RepID=A0A5B9D9H0_9ARCH|nr:hypothetical protein [Candidatus Prometheoarchaeum syntrophicum]
MGYPTLGRYLSQKVSKIHTDVVIFYAGSETTLRTEHGTMHLIFGLGYYYTKFEINPGEYIVDHKQLTGLILSDFVVNYMIKSKNLSISDESDVIFKENIVKVPLNLSNKPSNAITFIKGALMRNIFTPNKEIFLEMMKYISDPNSYQIGQYGHQVLSSHPEFYNKILISNKMENFPQPSYFECTAGIESIDYGFDIFAIDYFTQQDLDLIKLNIQLLKQVYSKVEIDPMYLFSIIENSANQLNSLFVQKVLPDDEKIPPVDSVETIFNTADYNFKTDVEWPEKFKRKSKMFYEAMVKPPKLKKFDYNASMKEKIKIPINYKGGPVEETEKFELSFLKHNSVEIKPLPKIPEGNIKEILSYLYSLVEGDYDMISIGKAFDLARENIRKIILQSDYMWDMSKIANYLLRQKPNLGLNQRDKKDYLEKINFWINGIEEEEMKKKEEEEIQRKIREEMKAKELEKERIEKARLANERIEKARLEREKIESEKRLEKAKLEIIKTAEILDSLGNQIINIEQQIVDLKNIKTTDKEVRKGNKKQIKKLKKDLKKLKKSLKKKSKGKK